MRVKPYIVIDSGLNKRLFVGEWLAVEVHSTLLEMGSKKLVGVYQDHRGEATMNKASYF